MKKIVLAVLMILFAVSAQAKELSFIWQYDTPPSDLMGFKIYKEDMMIKDIPDKLARSAAVTVADLGDGKTCFSSVAYDVAGQESEKSNTACYDPSPSSPAGFQVQVVVTVNVQ